MFHFFMYLNHDKIPLVAKENKLILKLTERTERGEMCSSKCFFIVANLILMALSLMLLIFSAIIQDFDSSYILFREYACTPTGLSIIFGSCLLCISWFALASVCLRSTFLLSVYFCILFVVTVVEVAIVIALLVMRSHVMNLITDSLLLAESKYAGDATASKTWNTLQRDLKCCGVDGHDEWFRYLGGSSVPDSCCVLYSVGCGSEAVRTGNFYETGCATAISNWSHRHVITIAIFFSLAMLSQIFSLLTSQIYRQTISE